MTKDEVEHAIGCAEAAIANKAAIRIIQAEGQGESERSVPLGLDAELSKPILEAALFTLAIALQRHR